MRQTVRATAYSLLFMHWAGVTWYSARAFVASILILTLDRPFPTENATPPPVILAVYQVQQVILGTSGDRKFQARRDANTNHVMTRMTIFVRVHDPPARTLPFIWYTLS